jgi:c(7)-type cytochrome triheme protein
MFFICKKGDRRNNRFIEMKGLSKLFLLFLILLALMRIQCAAETQEFGGGPIVFIKPVRAVIFEHKFHLSKKLNCQSCHPDLFAQKSGELEKKEDFTMAAFNQGKYCGRCHDGTIAFSVNTKCNWCHIGVQGHKHLEEYQLGIK